MKSYSIFVKKSKSDESIDDVILVREGFNFYALFFNILWFLLKKMWICSAVITAMICLICYIFSYSVATSIIFLILILLVHRSYLYPYKYLLYIEKLKFF